MNTTMRDDMPGMDSPGDDGAARADFAPAHRTQVFRKLLQREFWENRGGFFWAPVVMGAIVSVLTLLGSVTGSVMIGNRMSEFSDGNFNFDGLEIDGKTGVEAAARAFGMAGDATLLSGVGMACIVLAFVVFFYALGSLYDDRKDRSVLFWKSMPVSDAQMVLSKVAWALVLAPAIAVVVGLALGIVLWLVSAATATLNGIPGASGIFTYSHPFRTLLHVVANIPVYAFWALPTVGWLMLCSAWARTKPFLWAVLVPILGAVLISWLDSLPGISIPHDKVWYALVVRGLLSVVPGMWYGNDSVEHGLSIDGPDDLVNAIDLASSWQAFATAELWIGAVVGAAMIYAAIRLRRWRDEG